MLADFSKIDKTKIVRGYDDYKTEAKKLVQKFVRKRNLAYKILKDEYYLSFIVSWLMLADGTYDENHASKAKNSTYRVYLGKCAIYSILEEIIQNQSNIYTDNFEKYERNTPYLVSNENNGDFLRTCFKLKCLSKREKRILYMRFVEDKTMLEIGNKLEITKQRVEQILNYTLVKIKAVNNVL